MDDFVVRRRESLMALVAVPAALLAAFYLARFALAGDVTALVVGVALGLVALLHSFAWTSGRTPILVADETGIRIRLGSTWAGVPWDRVEVVEVERRGWLRDGQIVVIPADGADPTAGLDARSRWAVRVNRWLYDATLVAPYGLNMSTSAPDAVLALRGLAGERAPVVLLGTHEPSLDEEPTIEIVDVPAFRSDDPPIRSTRAVPLGADGGTSLSARVSAGAASRVDVAFGRQASEGTLALNATPDLSAAATLPEIDQLRRQSDPDSPRRGDAPLRPADPDAADGPTGNVSLIIDATTDLSAQAMQRMRRQAATQARAETDATPADDTTPGAVIGAQLVKARKNLYLSVDDLAERTRIRPYVIESIEIDDFAACGGDFYARGHLRMLARVLGLDAAPLIAAYDETFATQPLSARQVLGVDRPGAGTVRAGVGGANWGALIAAVLLLLLIWGVARFVTADAGNAPTSTHVTHNPQGLGSPGPGNPPVTVPATTHVKVTVTGDSHVVVKDRYRRSIIFEGRITAGTSRKFSGPGALIVRARHPVDLQLSQQGRLLGTVGKSDRAASRVVRPAR